MLSQQEARNLADKVLGYAKLPACQVSISSTENVFIRFANNGITTSGYTLNRTMAIDSVTEDHRSGRAVVNDWTEEALRRGVEQAEALARISRPNPEVMPALGPQKYPDIANFDEATGSARGDALIPHVKAMVEEARRRMLIASGFIERSARWNAVANKAGLFGYHQSTSCELTNTTRNTGGTSSGWAVQVSNAVGDLKGEEAARIAAEKCVRGVRKKRLDPGKYTVILEPAAVSDVIGFMGSGFGARQAEQGQTFLSKAGGAPGVTLLGEIVFPELITLRSDPMNPRFGAPPWSPQSLLPNEPVTWIGRGYIRNLSYDRFWAEKARRRPTPFPNNLVLEGQEHTLDDLIRAADKAILVTRLWYVRTLQPQTLQLTGLTRDGVFLVEKGKITDPLMNFRWNESPVRVLKNTQMMSRPEHTHGAEAGPSFSPAVLATDFNFASISDAV